MRAAKRKAENGARRRSEPDWPIAPYLAGEGHDDLLTQDEVAARLKVTVRTVARLQHDGVLPVIFLGKAVRFHWPAVISHLINNCTVCRTEPVPAPSASKGSRP